jgi:hypothetical protein
MFCGPPQTTLPNDHMTPFESRNIPPPSSVHALPPKPNWRKNGTTAPVASFQTIAPYATDALPASSSELPPELLPELLPAELPELLPAELPELLPAELPELLPDVPPEPLPEELPELLAELPPEPPLESPPELLLLPEEEPPEPPSWPVDPSDSWSSEELFAPPHPAPTATASANASQRGTVPCRTAAITRAT